MIIDRIAPLWPNYGRRDASYNVNEFDPRHSFTLTYQGETLFLGDEYELNRLSDQELINRLNNSFTRCAFLAAQRKQQKEIKPMYDESKAYEDDRKVIQAGQNVSKILLPFLRTDVSIDMLYDFGKLVSRWCGYPNNADFVQGFVVTFQQYREANRPKQLVTRSLIEDADSTQA